MGRPVKLRTSKSGYAADIAALSRMALAIKLDRRIAARTSSRIVDKLDDLVSELASLNRQIEV